MKNNKYNFLIVDGYPKESREEFKQNGMKEAGILYVEMLLKYLPDAQYTILNSSDEGAEIPDKNNIKTYDGVLWTGCNLTMYDTDDQRVVTMHEICKLAYESGIPQFGTCWGIQIGAYIADGEVKRNPKGREMGFGRQIALTEEGKKHPMFSGKPFVYNHFVSHDDEVTRLPKKSKLLAGNDFSNIQAAEIKYKKGVFWGLQYHPEYNLHEMAMLMKTRKNKLVELGFFKNTEDAENYINILEEIHNNPERNDLKWQIGIGDDILSDEIRQCEFKNWTNKFFPKN